MLSEVFIFSNNLAALLVILRNLVASFRFLLIFPQITLAQLLNKVTKIVVCRTLHQCLNGSGRMALVMLLVEMLFFLPLLKLFVLVITWFRVQLTTNLTSGN